MGKDGERGEKRPRRDSGRTRLCKLARLAHSNRGKDAFSRRVLVDFRKRRTMVHKDSYVEKRDSLENILT